MDLKYKTRGGSRPQGKARVYFCCHPSDFITYFDTISDKILAKQNCAVYYLEPDSNKDFEELSLYLKQMQLFVVIVSKNFLLTKNNELDTEFSFALKNHIPVLPIMVEDGLEENFNEKCGELQFLNLKSSDKTEISFDIKLEKFLEKFLIDDEFVNKIRDAFDAYIFLSYRKKDRKYAQMLMELIHKNDFCVNFAIWYDEFLVPGENFNAAIREALEKSDLFVMAVTPNIVNEENYIMSTEYPMARLNNKKILPVEMQPTDENELINKFENFPHLTKSYDEKEVSDALLKTVKEMALTKSDDSPEHNFFIGLAYLGGVDVEVDYKKAIELITDSAEKGLEQAVRKLVDIYENGIGTSIDHNMVIKWQIKYIDLLRNKLISHKEADFDCVMEYLNSILYLGIKYFDKDSFAYALECYESILDFLKKFSKFLGWNERLIRAGCYNNLAVIYSKTGDCKKAISYETKSVKLRESIFSKCPEYLCTELIDSYSNLSIYFDDLGNTSSAQKYIDKAINLYDKYKEKYDLNALYIAKAYTLKGTYSYGAKAEEYYIKAMEIFKVLMKHPNEDIRGSFADLLYKFGIFMNESSKTDDCEELLATCIEIYEKLYDKDPEKYIISLMNAYYEYSLCCKDIDDYECALNTSDLAVDIMTKADEMGKKDYFAFARVLKNECDILTDIKAYEEAKQYIEEALQYVKEETVSYKSAENLINLYNSAGRVYYKLCENDSAAFVYQNAIDLHQKFYKKDKDSVKQKLIGIVYYNYALLLYHNYNLKNEARIMADNAIKIFYKTKGCVNLLETVIEFKRKYIGYC